MRSYVLNPYQMVKDLRTEHEVGNTSAVFDGAIDDFIEAGIRWRTDNRNAEKLGTATLHGRTFGRNRATRPADSPAERRSPVRIVEGPELYFPQEKAPAPVADHAHKAASCRVYRVMIRFENVTKVYDQKARPALDSVSLEIDRGEFAFLVGASGSGKSTFLRLVLKEDRATSGTVYVAGQNVANISSWRVPRLRRGIGVVFQDFRLLPQKNVFANVAFAMQVIGKSRSVIRDTVPEVLKTVGLEGKEKRMPHELSGGEQQRVAIARAVVNRPGILLADEPTGNLDPTTSMGIMGVLDKINQNGTTVVMATHDDDIVNEMRKRVVELKNGNVIRDEARALYTSMIPVVGQSRRLKDASGRDDAADAAGPCPASTDSAPPQFRGGPAVRLQFILGEIGSGLRRNLSMVVSVILVTFVSLTFVGAAGMLQLQINQMKGYWYDKVQVAIFLCGEGSTAAGCASGTVDARAAGQPADPAGITGGVPVHQRLPVRVQGRCLQALQGTVLELSDRRFRHPGPASRILPDQHEGSGKIPDHQ